MTPLDLERSRAICECGHYHLSDDGQPMQICLDCDCLDWEPDEREMRRIEWVKARASFDQVAAQIQRIIESCGTPRSRGEAADVRSASSLGVSSRPQIWFVVESFAFQGDAIHGIYTTAEAAKKAAIKIEGDAGRVDGPWPLDAPFDRPHWMGN